MTRALDDRGPEWCGLAVLALAALLQLPPRATAQHAPAAPARAQLQLVADEGCATRAAIVERVRRRSARIELGDFAGASAAQLRIVIQPDARAGVSAELEVRWPSGQRAQRRLTAANCEDAQEAIALLVALMLDPMAPEANAAPAGERPARAQRPQSPRAPDPGHGPAAPAGDAADAANATTEPTTAEPAVPAPALESEAPQTPPAAPAVPARPAAQPAASALEDVDSQDQPAADPLAFEELAFGLSAVLVAGPAPDPMPGIGLSALVGLRGAGLFAPALLLRGMRVLRDGVSAPGGVADFRLDALELGLCPLRLRAGPFAARACLTGALGSLEASGSESYSPQSHSRLWAELGGALRLGLDLFGPVQLQAGFGAAAALERYRFAFRPEVFYRVAPVRFGGELGLGLRFP